MKSFSQHEDKTWELLRELVVKPVNYVIDQELTIWSLIDIADVCQEEEEELE